MPTKEIILLDGGVGQEINRRATHTESHPQWSVKVMHDTPKIVVQVQKEFIEAGAKIISLNNYTATPSRMKRYDMMDQYEQTHALAAQCANEALAQTDVARDEVNIAGCLPPLAASYVTEGVPPYTQAYDEYCSLIEQQKPLVDLFLVETMSNLVELTAALDALKHYNEKSYVALTCKDDASITLRSGQPLSDALALLRERNAEAVMINCCYPETVDSVIDALSRSSLTFGAYANGFKSVEPLTLGTTVDLLDYRADLTAERYTQHAMSWVEKGAKIIGGCCEISPQHIAHLHVRLQEKGYKIRKLL